jgi:hypothetical protein
MADYHLLVSHRWVLRHCGYAILGHKDSYSAIQVETSRSVIYYNFTHLRSSGMLLEEPKISTLKTTSEEINGFLRKTFTLTGCCLPWHQGIAPWTY